MLELCMVIGISIGFLDGIEQRVSTLDCSSIEYKAIEFRDELIEVIQEGNIIYIKGDNG